MYAAPLEYHTPTTHGEECTPSYQSGASPRPPPFSKKILTNMDPSTLEIPSPIGPHHNKQGQTLHRHRCRSHRGMDGNSSMGTNNGNIRGPFGGPHTNDAGRRMHSFLSIRGLTTTTTFFQKKSYGTWIHPRSKLPHQLDHIITNKDKLCTVTYAGVTEIMVD